MQITDIRIRKVEKEGKMKAVVSITIDDEFVVATAFDCFMHSQSLSYTFQESYSGYSRVWQS